MEYEGKGSKSREEMMSSHSGTGFVHLDSEFGDSWSKISLNPNVSKLRFDDSKSHVSDSTQSLTLAEIHENIIYQQFTDLKEAQRKWIENSRQLPVTPGKDDDFKGWIKCSNESNSLINDKQSPKRKFDNKRVTVLERNLNSCPDISIDDRSVKTGEGTVSGKAAPKKTILTPVSSSFGFCAVPHLKLNTAPITATTFEPVSKPDKEFISEDGKLVKVLKIEQPTQSTSRPNKDKSARKTKLIDSTRGQSCEALAKTSPEEVKKLEKPYCVRTTLIPTSDTVDAIEKNQLDPKSLKNLVDGSTTNLIEKLNVEIKKVSHIVASNKRQTADTNVEYGDENEFKSRSIKKRNSCPGSVFATPEKEHSSHGGAKPRKSYDSKVTRNFIKQKQKEREERYNEEKKRKALENEERKKKLIQLKETQRKILQHCKRRALDEKPQWIGPLEVVAKSPKTDIRTPPARRSRGPSTLATGAVIFAKPMTGEDIKLHENSSNISLRSRFGKKDSDHLDHKHIDLPDKGDNKNVGAYHHHNANEAVKSARSPEKISRSLEKRPRSREKHARSPEKHSRSPEKPFQSPDKSVQSPEKASRSPEKSPGRVPPPVQECLAAPMLNPPQVDLFHLSTSTDIDRLSHISTRKKPEIKEKPPPEQKLVSTKKRFKSPTFISSDMANTDETKSEGEKRLKISHGKDSKGFLRVPLATYLDAEPWYHPLENMKTSKKECPNWLKELQSSPPDPFNLINTFKRKMRFAEVESQSQRQLSLTITKPTDDPGTNVSEMRNEQSRELHHYQKKTKTSQRAVHISSEPFDMKRLCEEEMNLKMPALSLNSSSSHIDEKLLQLSRDRINRFADTFGKPLQSMSETKIKETSVEKNKEHIIDKHENELRSTASDTTISESLSVDPLKLSHSVEDLNLVYPKANQHVTPSEEIKKSAATAEVSTPFGTVKSFTTNSTKNPTKKNVLVSVTSSEFHKVHNEVKHVLQETDVPHAHEPPNLTHSDESPSPPESPNLPRSHEQQLLPHTLEVKTLPHFRDPAPHSSEPPRLVDHQVMQHLITERLNFTDDPNSNNSSDSLSEVVHVSRTLTRGNNKVAEYHSVSQSLKVNSMHLTTRAPQTIEETSSVSQNRFITPSPSGYQSKTDEKVREILEVTSLQNSSDSVEAPNIDQNITFTSIETYSPTTTVDEWPLSEMKFTKISSKVFKELAEENREKSNSLPQEKPNIDLLIAETKSDIERMENRRRKLIESGRESEAAVLKKKERAMMLKLYEDLKQIFKLRKLEKTAREKKSHLDVSKFEVLPSQPNQKGDHKMKKSELRSHTSCSLLAPNPQLSLDRHNLECVNKTARKLQEKEEQLKERKRNADAILQWKRRLEMEERQVKEVESLIAQSAFASPLPYFTYKALTDKIDRSTSPFMELNPNTAPEVAYISRAVSPIKKMRAIEPDLKDEYSDSFELSSGLSDHTLIQASAASKKKSLNFNYPLSPRVTIMRRHSTGSEESITQSQNDTLSEQSDMEVRVSALQQQLRQRKIELDKLRREYHKSKRERLLAKEQSLINQIQAYDSHIEQVKTELQRELDKPDVKVTKPQIKRPKFAERRKSDISLNISSLKNKEHILVTSSSSDNLIITPNQEASLIDFRNSLSEKSKDKTSDRTFSNQNTTESSDKLLVESRSKRFSPQAKSLISDLKEVSNQNKTVETEQNEVSENILSSFPSKESETKDISENLEFDVPSSPMSESSDPKEISEQIASSQEKSESKLYEISEQVPTASDIENQQTKISELKEISEKLEQIQNSISQPILTDEISIEEINRNSSSSSKDVTDTLVQEDLSVINTEIQTASDIRKEWTPSPTNRTTISSAIPSEKSGLSSAVPKSAQGTPKNNLSVSAGSEISSSPPSPESFNNYDEYISEHITLDISKSVELKESDSKLVSAASFPNVSTAEPKSSDKNSSEPGSPIRTLSLSKDFSLTKSSLNTNLKSSKPVSEISNIDSKTHSLLVAENEIVPSESLKKVVNDEKSSSSVIEKIKSQSERIVSENQVSSESKVSLSKHSCDKTHSTISQSERIVSEIQVNSESKVSLSKTSSDKTHSTVKPSESIKTKTSSDKTHSTVKPSESIKTESSISTVESIKTGEAHSKKENSINSGDLIGDLISFPKSPKTPSPQKETKDCVSELSKSNKGDKPTQSSAVELMKLTLPINPEIPRNVDVLVESVLIENIFPVGSPVFAENTNKQHENNYEKSIQEQISEEEEDRHDYLPSENSETDEEESGYRIKLYSDQDEVELRKTRTELVNKNEGDMLSLLNDSFEDQLWKENLEFKKTSEETPLLSALQRERQQNISVDIITSKISEQCIAEATDAIVIAFNKKKRCCLYNRDLGEEVFDNQQELPDLEESQGNQQDEDSSLWHVEGLSPQAIKEAHELRLKQLQIEQEIEELEAQEATPYFYVREIPNKPPPPYTPPRYSPPTPEETVARVCQGAGMLWDEEAKGGDPTKINLPDNFLPNIQDQPYREFMFDLAKDLFLKFKPPAESTKPPWLVVNRYRRPLPPIKDKKDLLKNIEREAKYVFGFDKKIQKENMIMRWTRKKRDLVDEILVRELQEEEVEWTDFSIEENIIKNQIANDLNAQMIDEAVMSISLAFTKKFAEFNTTS